MSFKTILLHVADDDQLDRRLAVAKKIALAHDAHITALYIPASASFAHAGRGASAIYRAQLAELGEEVAAKARQAFEKDCDRQGISHHWVVEDGDHYDVLEKHARAADLLIVSQAERKFLEDYVRTQLNEELVLSSGIPVLIIPRDWDGKVLGRHVAVGWNSTRESVRALRDALPVFETADKVTLLTVGSPEETGRLPADQAVRYLARHGITADLRQDFDAHTSVGHVLLKQQESIGADLLVIGAYGQSRWRELMLGGATKTIFSEMKTPVLMSH